MKALYWQPWAQLNPAPTFSSPRNPTQHRFSRTRDILLLKTLIAERNYECWVRILVLPIEVSHLQRRPTHTPSTNNSFRHFIFAHLSYYLTMEPKQLKAALFCQVCYVFQVGHFLQRADQVSDFVCGLLQCSTGVKWNTWGFYCYRGQWKDQVILDHKGIVSFF